MPIYVALLRGINVGGQKIVNMEKLRASFATLEFNSVRTYVQSGNVIFISMPIPSKQPSRMMVPLVARPREHSK